MLLSLAGTHARIGSLAAAYRRLPRRQRRSQVTAEGTASPAGGGGHPAKAARAKGKGRITSIEGIPALSLDAISE